MYITENLTINSGDLPVGDAVIFDLPIVSRWCKIVSIKIVQLTAGAMHIDFEVWESTAARAGPVNRANLYQLPLTRNITIVPAGGAQYSESLAGSPMPYKDRDAVDEERTYRLHCRLENFNDGTLSDFAVSIKIADIGENA